MASETLRIVKKVKKGHGGHHGGSWKVAYADFMTALMAFFLVMWIVGLDQVVKNAVAGYFKDPVGFMKAVEGGKSPLGQGGALDSMLTKMAKKTDESVKEDKKRFEHAKSAINDVIARYPEFKGIAKSVDVKIVNEGLRIDLVESSQDLFFDSGSAATKPRTRQLLGLIAKELGNLPNKVIIEGHTDSRQYQGPNGWTNWELSTARANAARRVMEASGLHSGQMVEVRGYADRIPRDPNHKDSFINRRVSILLPFQELPEKLRDSRDITSEKVEDAALKQ
ncbi:MAG: flagellar motor protein MotB [Armatimonadota bacterium]